MRTPTQSPAPCVHLRIKASITKHGNDSGAWCEWRRQYVTSGRLGTCVLCGDFDETRWPPDKAWRGVTL